MANKIQLRRDTSANWTRVNPILADGEPGVDITNKKIKYGDGSTAWRDLAYASGAATATGDPTKLVNGSHQVVLQANGVTTFNGGAYFDGYDFFAGGPYIELGSNDLNNYIGVDNGAPFIQTAYLSNNYVWTFSGAGELNLPTPGKLVNNNHVWTYDANGGFTVPGVINSTAGTGNVVVQSSNTTIWTFVTDGGLNPPILTAAPGSPVTGAWYTADGVTWDPASKSGAVPYPVFYDGVTYNALY